MLLCMVRLPANIRHERCDGLLPKSRTFRSARRSFSLLAASRIVSCFAGGGDHMGYSMATTRQESWCRSFSSCTAWTPHCRSAAKPVFGMGQTQTHSLPLIVLTTTGSDRSRSTLYKKVAMESWSWGLELCIDHSHTRSRARAFTLFPAASISTLFSSSRVPSLV
jgi:hypothetical protein